MQGTHRVAFGSWLGQHCFLKSIAGTMSRDIGRDGDFSAIDGETLH